MWWLLLVQVGLNLLVTTIVFGTIVWSFAILSMKASGVAPWPWTWGLKWNLVDWTHHFFYVTGTLLGWVAIEKIVEYTGGSWAV